MHLFKKIKRPVALFLAVLLVFSLVPMSAIGMIANATTSEFLNQVVNQPEKNLTNTWSEPKKFEEGKVTTEKKILQTGENKFDITLQVKTTEEIKENGISPDAAVVLVMDTSNSMSDCTVCSKFKNDYNHSKYNSSRHDFQSRLDAAKIAAKNFVADFIKGAGNAKRQISIVAYQTGASVKSNWIDAKTKTAEINEIIDGFKAAGATAMDAGLTLAHNLINIGRKNDNMIKGIENISVILLTDGVPTYRLKDGYTHKEDSENLIDIIKANLNGDGTEGNALKNTVSVEKEISHIKDKAKANVFTIAFGEDVKFTNGTTIQQWLTPRVDKFVYAKDAADLNEAFKSINEIIKKYTEAWIVEDPMGENIIFKGLHKNDNLASTNLDGKKEDVYTTAVTFVKDDKFDSEDIKNTLYWNLKKDFTRVEKSEPMNGVTTSTYTLTYSIELNTEKFENKEFDIQNPIATNGITTLTYAISEIRNDQTISLKIGTADFNVPQVVGKAPIVEYSIIYQKKDKQTGDYVTVESDSLINQKGHLNETITVKDYTDKYVKDNYKLKDATPSLKLSKTGNVLTFTYDPMPANIVVDTYIRKETIATNGSITYSEYVKQPNSSIINGLYVGDSYTITPPSMTNLKYDGVNNNQSLTFDKLKTDNLIGLLYTSTEDNSVKASAKVNYVFIDYHYVINESTGRYELEEKRNTNNAIEYHGLYAGNSFTPKDEKWSLIGYEIVNPADLEAKILVEGLNSYTVTYAKTTDERPNTIPVTVEHYFKTITGANPNPDYVKAEENDTIDGYRLGETFEFSSITKRTDANFSFDKIDPDLTEIIVGRNNYKDTVKVYYSYDNTTPESVEVNYHYKYSYWERVIEYKLDDEGNPTEEVIGSKLVLNETPEVVVANTITTGIFVDRKFTPADMPINDKKTYNRIGSLPEITIIDGENKVDVYYELVTEEVTDSRPTANFTISHKYYDFITYVKEGSLVEDEKTINNTVATADNVITTNEKNEPLRIGDSIDFLDKIAEKDGYKRFDKNETSTIITVVNGAVTFDYGSKINNAKESKIKVQPIFVVKGYYTDDTGNLVETYVEEPINIDYIKEYTSYIGMNFTANTTEFNITGKEEYKFDDKYTKETKNVVYEDVILGTTENNTTINLYFIKSAPKVPVKVNHIFNYNVHIIENGQPKVNTTTETIKQTSYNFIGTNFDVLIDELLDNTDIDYKYDTTDDRNTNIFTDGKMTVAVKENNNEYNLYYSAENKAGLVETSYKISYKFFTKELYDGAEVEVTDDLLFPNNIIENSGYVGQNIGVSEYQKLPEGYKLAIQDDPALNMLTLDADSNKNVRVIKYIKEIDSRINTSVKIIHIFKDKNTGLNTETEVGIKEEVKNTYNDGVWIGNKYTATSKPTLINKNDDGTPSGNQGTYAMTTLDEDLVINSLVADTVTEGEAGNTVVINNVITITYVREYEEPTTVKVTYNFVTKSRNSGNTLSTITEIKTFGVEGQKLYATQEFTAPDATNTDFEFVSASPSRKITLVKEDSGNAIIMNYVAYVNDGSNVPTIPPTPVIPDLPVEEIDPVDPPLVEPEVPEEEIIDPTETPLEKPEEEEIIDTDVPLDGGEEEIIADDVPLAKPESPQTGDSTNMFMMMMIAILSLGSTIFFGFKTKKRNNK